MPLFALIKSARQPAVCLKNNSASNNRVICIKETQMCEFAGHYLSTAHESVVEIWDNSARLSGSDTISGFQQRIDIPLAAGIIVRRER